VGGWKTKDHAQKRQKEIALFNERGESDKTKTRGRTTNKVEGFLLGELAPVLINLSTPANKKEK